MLQIISQLSEAALMINFFFFPCTLVPSFAIFFPCIALIFLYHLPFIQLNCAFLRKIERKVFVEIVFSLKMRNKLHRNVHPWIYNIFMMMQHSLSFLLLFFLIHRNLYLAAILASGYNDEKKEWEKEREREGIYLIMGKNQLNEGWSKHIFFSFRYGEFWMDLQVFRQPFFLIFKQT